ncbi:MAG: hypothetical protein Q9166_005520 [cf. Caloplaca sp. 2 TL-2023]
MTSGPKLPVTFIIYVACLALQVSAVPQCKRWLGSPDFAPCKALLLGQTDGNHIREAEAGAVGNPQPGDNGQLLLVIYARGSDFDKNVLNTPVGKIPGLEEAEDETDDEYDPSQPPTKKIKTEPSSVAQGSSTQVGYSATNALSANIGSGWIFNYHAVKPMLAVDVAARNLVAFYNSVVDKTSALMEAAAPLVKTHAFTVGEITLVLVGTNIIYWDWIITFVMAMVDSTNQHNPIQFAATIANTWQQNTIKAELLLGGMSVA